MKSLFSNLLQLVVALSSQVQFANAFADAPTLTLKFNRCWFLLFHSAWCRSVTKLKQCLGKHPCLQMSLFYCSQLLKLSFWGRHKFANLQVLVWTIWHLCSPTCPLLTKTPLPKYHMDKIICFVLVYRISKKSIKLVKTFSGTSNY